MTLRLVVALLIAALFALPACGSLPQGQVPADSELKPWEAPETDDLVEEDDGEDEDESAGEVEEAEEEEEASDDAAEAGSDG